MDGTKDERVSPLRILADEADDYCDPETGVCAVPGAAGPERTVAANGESNDGETPGD